MEMEQLFDKFLKYHMQKLLGDFSAKVGRVYISNQQLGKNVYVKLVLMMKFRICHI
jgi:hypothetical protein